VIHICIPVHNEEATIGVLLWKIRKVMGEFGRDYTILVLDDGSTDGTRDALERYRRALPLKVLREEAPVGYAVALERLLREAAATAAYPKRDVVVTMQGDFTENPEGLLSLIKAMEGGADIVAGRGDPGNDRPPRGVRMVEWLAPFLLGRAFRRAPVADPLCGFRAYRVIVLRKAIREQGDAPLVTGAGRGANLELLGRLAPFARRIEEVPVPLRFRERPRASRFQAMESLRRLLQVRGRVEWTVEEEGGERSA